MTAADSVVRAVPPAARRPASGPPARWRRRLRRLAIVGVVVLLLLGGGTALAWLATPSVADAQSRVAARNAADGADFPGSVPSSKVVAALVATEDASFYANDGVDVRGAVRGAWGTVR